MVGEGAIADGSNGIRCTVECYSFGYNHATAITDSCHTRRPIGGCNVIIYAVNFAAVGEGEGGERGEERQDEQECRAEDCAGKEAGKCGMGCGSGCRVSHRRGLGMCRFFIFEVFE